MHDACTLKSQRIWQAAALSKFLQAVARHCVHCGLCLPNKLSYADAGLLTFLLHLAGLLTALLLPLLLSPQGLGLQVSHSRRRKDFSVGISERLLAPVHAS